jgi:hypothetical protein
MKRKDSNHEFSRNRHGPTLGLRIQLPLTFLY